MLSFGADLFAQWWYVSIVWGFLFGLSELMGFAGVCDIAFITYVQLESGDNYPS